MHGILPDSSTCPEGRTHLYLCFPLPSHPLAFFQTATLYTRDTNTTSLLSVCLCFQPSHLDQAPTWQHYSLLRGQSSSKNQSLLSHQQKGLVTPTCNTCSPQPPTGHKSQEVHIQYCLDLSCISHFRGNDIFLKVYQICFMLILDSTKSEPRPRR